MYWISRSINGIQESIRWSNKRLELQLQIWYCGRISAERSHSPGRPQRTSPVKCKRPPLHERRKNAFDDLQNVIWSYAQARLPVAPEAAKSTANNAAAGIELPTHYHGPKGISATLDYSSSNDLLRIIVVLNNFLNQSSIFRI